LNFLRALLRAQDTIKYAVIDASTAATAPMTTIVRVEGSP